MIELAKAIQDRAFSPDPETQREGLRMWQQVAGQIDLDQEAVDALQRIHEANGGTH